MAFKMALALERPWAMMQVHGPHGAELPILSVIKALEDTAKMGPEQPASQGPPQVAAHFLFELGEQGFSYPFLQTSTQYCPQTHRR